MERKTNNDNVGIGLVPILFPIIVRVIATNKQNMKKQIGIFLLFVFSLSSVFSYSKENIKFKFDKNGQFKIAQFTDIHWDNTSANCAKTIETIKHVIATEKPDIAILTGDVVSDAPIKKGWLAVAKIFEETKTPWAAVMGNHDTEEERGFSRCDIFDLIEDLPYFVGEKGLAEIGCGNYVIPVLGSKSTDTKAALYCVDSHDYPQNKKFGHYDWIHFDQIDWYRKTSDAYTLKNNNKPLPSLAFFHIPLIEYNNIVGKNTTIGTKGEGIASADINSGMFASMVEKQDIMGVFVGHDHDNDYIGIEKDIALAFGRVSGTDAYGKLERGARIIAMYEDQPKFDTWIRTTKGTELYYYYPSGISSVDEQNMTYLPAQNIKAKKQGVTYNYYEGKFKSVDDVVSHKPLKSGTLNNFSIESAAAKDYFAFEFKAYIKIPEKGVYRFYTNSDDGSKLYIDGELIVDNDGSHSLRRVDGKVALEAGFHEIIVRYLENYMGEALEIGFSSRNIFETLIPNEMLFVKE